MGGTLGRMKVYHRGHGGDEVPGAPHPRIAAPESEVPAREIAPDARGGERDLDGARASARADAAVAELGRERAERATLAGDAFKREDDLRAALAKAEAAAM